ncbi:hypothetical protein [Amycolatopsis sp. Hca4]|uniref:hypothetical protein n=1 Tax=Amycolatopsis sp. Hca4 TaxID=2742131 RepID=UPI001592A565|nr:hypothetical protein [Amycolatopsis sp. Hca4]QKV74983.1 hypothetical protein HUT10_15295 [Amycolatopsis sp. Hca4]
MTTPQAPSTPDQTWGATPAPAAKQPWSPGRKIAAGAVAAAIVAGGGAAVWAASSSAATDTQAGPGGMMGGPGGLPGGGLGSALHGEYVASDGNGGYVTKIVQTGEVTELSATSLTAKSDDGFSKTYTITSDQATGLATGDTVTVVATESGSTATATSVTDGDAGGQGAPARTG